VPGDSADVMAFIVSGGVAGATGRITGSSRAVPAPR
jgi:hypothetical protein